MSSITPGFDIFGQIVSGDQLESAVTATLKKWFKTYLNELKLQGGITDDIALPKSWNVRPEDDRWVEDMLPAVVVISPGLSEPPLMEGDGTYRAIWTVGVAIFNTANTRPNVNRNSKVYAAVTRAILLQKRSLGGFADNCTWIGEDYDEGTEEGLRTYGVSVVNFQFQVSYVVDKEGGPIGPDPDDEGDPGDDWPIATSDHVDVILVPPDEEVPIP